MTTYNYKDVLKNDSAGQKNFQIKINISGTLTPIDLTSVVIRGQFRKDTKIGSLIKTITIGNGIIVTDAVLGEFTISDFIVDFEVATYYYDVQFTYPDGRVVTYFGGIMRVLQDVTQPV